MHHTKEHTMRDITYWDPFRDMTQLRSEIEGLIDRAASGAKSAVGAPWRPVSDIVETDDSIMITAELPGCKDEDVEVVVRGRVLTIRGSREIQEKSEGEHYRRVERSYGDFARSFRLPDGITENDIHAKVAYGVLQIKIKLPENRESTRIHVSGGE
jgi:HSP20 family protein